LGEFSLAGSFRCLFLLLFVGALYVAWVLFYVGLFSVRTLFFSFFLWVEEVGAHAVRNSLEFGGVGWPGAGVAWRLCYILCTGLLIDEL
jgi:hypothetical protein